MLTRLPTASAAYALFGLVGEVGELFSLVAKDIRDDKYEDEVTAKAVKELGDILWFIAAIAQDMGATLEDVAQGNIDKLARRKASGTLQGSGDNR